MRRVCTVEGAKHTYLYWNAFGFCLLASRDCENLRLSLILSKVLHCSLAENCASHSSSPPPVTLVVRGKANASENNTEIHDMTGDENTGRVFHSVTWEYIKDEYSMTGTEHTGKEHRKNVGSPQENWLQTNWEAHDSWGEYGKMKSSW